LSEICRAPGKRHANAMPTRPTAIQLPPASRWQALTLAITRLFDLEHMRLLEILLDEAFVIPGTGIRFGLDGIIGLVPGLGDVLAGLLSLIIPLVAWVRGVAYITLLRMVANLAIGVLIGTIPVFGDAFDIWWKANRRNYNLLTRSIAEPHRHTGRDWLFLLALAATISAIFAAPVFLVLWIALQIMHGIAAWHG